MLLRSARASPDRVLASKLSRTRDGSGTTDRTSGAGAMTADDRPRIPRDGSQAAAPIPPRPVEAQVGRVLSVAGAAIAVFGFLIALLVWGLARAQGLDGPVLRAATAVLVVAGWGVVVAAILMCAAVIRRRRPAPRTRTRRRRG